MDDIYGNNIFEMDNVDITENHIIDSVNIVPTWLKGNDLINFKSMEILSNKSFASRIDKYIDEFCISNDKNVKYHLLTKLIDLITTFRPQNFIEYNWLIKFTCFILLLNDFPIIFSIQQSKLLQYTFQQIPNDIFCSDPIKIHITAKSIYDLITDDYYNLHYIITLIGTINNFIYYVFITIIWAAIHKFINNEQDTKFFRMHEVSEFITILENIKLSNFDYKLPDLHRLLTIITLFQNLIILQPNQDKSKTFSKFLKVTETNFNLFHNFLRSMEEYVDIIYNRNDNFKNDCIEIKDMLELNMLKQMDGVINKSLYF